MVRPKHGNDRLGSEAFGCAAPLCLMTFFAFCGGNLNDFHVFGLLLGHVWWVSISRGVHGWRPEKQFCNDFLPKSRMGGRVGGRVWSYLTWPVSNSQGACICENVIYT